MSITPKTLLSEINAPKDLKKLDIIRLPQLCSELRQFIIDMVSTHGGHFAASLGVVELTVALHYVFDTPHDKLIWDVGHQAYGHKILTGRRDSFSTNRKYKGISGFPKMDESEYDAFGTGHSSTSISAALGMATAALLDGDTARSHIAVIGDSAIESGMAFEGLNNAGFSKANILIILNDNSMAIDPNVGAFNKYLATLKPQSGETNFNQDQGNLFQDLGFLYRGPIDGHNVDALINQLIYLKNQPGPKLLHIKTTKGKGYHPAEANQTDWHATGAFDKITGRTYQSGNIGEYQQKYQYIFGQTLLELARANDNIVAVTPAMLTGSGLKLMQNQMPERVFDVGISEQHAVTFSAGLASENKRVFCTIYSTFLQRAYDQVIHDVAVQNLPVIFCIDRAGLVGEDGPTHHGVFDMSFMRAIPNMIVAAPMNELELRNLMFTAQSDSNKHPFTIRYPRGKATGIDWHQPFQKIPIGKGRKIIDGEHIAILTIGKPGTFVSNIMNNISTFGINPAHYDFRFLKPIDTSLLHEIFSKFNKIITVEDGVLSGGFGDAVIEFANKHQYHAIIKTLGIADRFIMQGSLSELYFETGIDEEAIIRALKELS